MVLREILRILKRSKERATPDRVRIRRDSPAVLNAPYDDVLEYERVAAGPDAPRDSSL